MRLDDLPESTNVSDQRGMHTTGGITAGGGGLLLLILGLIFGVDPRPTRHRRSRIERPAAQR